MSNILAILSKALLNTPEQADTLNIWDSTDQTNNFSAETKKPCPPEIINSTKTHQNIDKAGFAMLFSKDSKDD